MTTISTDVGPNTFFSHIIIPETIISIKTRAFLVGWNLDGFRCCVACTIPITENVNISDIEIAVSKASKKLKKICNCTSSRTGTVKPILLGEWIPSVNDNMAIVPPESAGIWIILTVDANILSTSNQLHPKLHALYSLGCKYTTSCYMVQYSTMDTDRLYCLVEEDSGLNSIGLDSFDSMSLGYRKTHSNISSTDLTYIIAQINAAQDLEVTIRQILPCQDEIIQRRSSIFSRLGCIQRLLKALLEALSLAETMLVWLWLKMINTIRLVFEKKYSVSNLTIAISKWLGIRGSGAQASGTGGPPVSTSGFSVCDISLSAAQLAQRFLSHECSFYKSIFFPRSWGLPIHWRKLLWMEVCTFVTSILVDISLGALVGYYVLCYTDSIVAFLTTLCWKIERKFLLDILDWFNHSPGGIKLNPLITTKISAGMGLIIRNFGYFFKWSAPLHTVITKFIACCGCFGLSVQLSMCADVIRIFTLHIAVIHRVCAVFHKYQIELICSLFQLFRGKKINILRKRVDTCEYDKQQLLFGTVLFAINIFLFPSFAAYFYLFALAQLLVVLAQHIIWTISITIKDFPYYALATLIFDPQILSDGITFNFLGPFSTEAGTVTHRVLAGPKGKSNRGGKKISEVSTLALSRSSSIFSFGCPQPSTCAPQPRSQQSLISDVVGNCFSSQKELATSLERQTARQSKSVSFAPQLEAAALGSAAEGQRQGQGQSQMSVKERDDGRANEMSHMNSYTRSQLLPASAFDEKAEIIIIMPIETSVKDPSETPIPVKDQRGSMTGASYCFRGPPRGGVTSGIEEKDEHNSNKQNSEKNADRAAHNASHCDFVSSHHGQGSFPSPSTAAAANRVDSMDGNPRLQAAWAGGGLPEEGDSESSVSSEDDDENENDPGNDDENTFHKVYSGRSSRTHDTLDDCGDAEIGGTGEKTNDDEANTDFVNSFMGSLDESDYAVAGYFDDEDVANFDDQKLFKSFDGIEGDEEDKVKDKRGNEARVGGYSMGVEGSTAGYGEDDNASLPTSPPLSPARDDNDRARDSPYEQSVTSMTLSRLTGAGAVANSEATSSLLNVSAAILPLSSHEGITSSAAGALTHHRSVGVDASAGVVVSANVDVGIGNGPDSAPVGRFTQISRMARTSANLLSSHNNNSQFASSRQSRFVSAVGSMGSSSLGGTGGGVARLTGEVPCSSPQSPRQRLLGFRASGSLVDRLDRSGGSSDSILTSSRRGSVAISASTISTASAALPTCASASSTSSSASSSAVVPTTTYIRLTSRRTAVLKLFARFGVYWRYLVSTKGLLVRLFSGIVTGHPALDIQLIQATVDLADPRLCRFTYPTYDNLDDDGSGAAGPGGGQSDRPTIDGNGTCDDGFASAAATAAAADSADSADSAGFDGDIASDGMWSTGNAGRSDMKFGDVPSASPPRVDQQYSLDLDSTSYWSAISQRKKRDSDASLWGSSGRSSSSSGYGSSISAVSEERTDTQRYLSWILFRLTMLTMVINVLLVLTGMCFFLVKILPQPTVSFLNGPLIEWSLHPTRIDAPPSLVVGGNLDTVIGTNDTSTLDLNFATHATSIMQLSDVANISTTTSAAARPLMKSLEQVGTHSSVWKRLLLASTNSFRMPLALADLPATISTLLLPARQY